jgi:hypothetical protein
MERTAELEKLLSEMKPLMRATASADENESARAYKEFCAAIKTPILQEIKYQSTARQLFAVEMLEPGAQAVYPVADDFDLPVWVLPGLGYAAQNFVEGAGEDVYVPTFTIDTSAEWKLQYARESRVDIAARAVRRAAAAIAEYEEESAWRIIVPAGTTDFAATGLLKARSAPVYEVAAAGSGAGYLSKELINAMIVGFQRVGRTLTDLWVAPEDAADIREWTDTDVDPVTRREIFQAAGMGSLWNIQLHVLPHLGQQGKFNINDSTSSYGIFKGDGGDDYNDYHLDNANICDSNGAVTTAGETQIWGFDMTANDSLVMPVKQEFQTWEDTNLHRRQKQGFYGWEEIGMACLDSRMLAMGVIDRTI